MGSELRTDAPTHATGAVVFVSLEEIAADQTFRLRPVGDVSVLAASIGRVGQLLPVELRPLPGADPDAAAGIPRYQLVAGFRRVAALELLQRDRVLSRVHQALGDDDAWALSLVQALTGEPLPEAELLALRDRLLASGIAPWALDLIEEARSRAPLPAELRERFYELLPGTLPAAAGEGAGSEDEEAPASGEGEGAGPEAPGEEVEEVAADDFARELALQMARLNQDLATAYGSWSELPEVGRRLILAQARYVAQLLPYLEEAEG